MRPKTSVKPLATRKYRPANVTPFRIALTNVFFPPSSPSSQSGQMPKIIQSSSSAGQKTGADPDLSRCRAGGGICDGKAHAVSRRRCSFILGAL